MPFFVTNRSESCANRRGTHESTAMFERMRGPSIKPVCAATKRSAPSATSVMTTRYCPTGTPPSRQGPNNRSASTAFHKDQEDWEQKSDRLFDSPQVEHYQQDHDHDFGFQLCVR